MALTAKVKVSERARAEIENMIFSSMEKGDRLPTEEKLSEMFDASRTSIREALKALEISKIVEKRNGGTFVADAQSECFVEPLRIMLQMDTAKLKDLLEIRTVLETSAAELAALNATAEDIAELEKIVWLIQKPDIEREEYISWDIEFHLLIAKAAGNGILLQLIRDVSDVMANSYPRVCTLEVIQEKAIPQQIQILNAVKTRDSEMAKKWMHEHLHECEEKFYLTAKGE